jgi:hypothetical protein
MPTDFADPYTAAEAASFKTESKPTFPFREACDTEIYDAARFYAPGGERSQVGGDSFDDGDGDGDRVEGWAPLRLHLCVFAGCLSLRAMRGGADEVRAKAGRGGETRSRSFANVQAGDESVVGGGGRQVRAEVFVER